MDRSSYGVRNEGWPVIFVSKSRSLETNLTGPSTSDSASDVPLFGLKGLPLAFVLSVLMCWPIWLTGSAFVYPDTKAYFDGGKEIWSIFENRLPGLFESREVGGTGGDPTSEENLTQDDDGPRFARSLFYPALAYPLISFGGPSALALFQGMFSAFAVFALIDRRALRSPLVLVSGAVVTIAFSTLAWHTVYMMPDILAATLLIFAATIVSTFRGMTGMQRLTITLMATFAAGSHYGNMPLILGLVLVSSFIAIFRRRLTLFAVAAMMVVVGTPPALNMMASSVVLEEASAAPLRLPVLLARFLEDGSAVDYLEENCPDVGYTMCTAFDGRIPNGIDELLWDENGLRSLDAETMSRIREEELPLVKDVLLAYPMRQTAKLIRNARRQLFAAGTQQINTATPWNSKQLHPQARVLLQRFNKITQYFTLFAAIVLIILAATRKLPRNVSFPLLVIFLGLLGNALIFGGLSSPADRYSSRIVWLLPVFVTIALASIIGGRRADGQSSAQ